MTDREKISRLIEVIRNLGMLVGPETMERVVKAHGVTLDE